MATFHADRHPAEATSGTSTGYAVGGADEVLGPVMAGAHARGVAETLDLLDLPGLFLDRSGEVIFASRAAAPLLRGALQLQARHLVADGVADNRALAAFIAEAVGGDRTPTAAHLPGAGLTLHRLPRTAGSALPGQLVRAVVILADDADSRHAAILQGLVG